MTKAWGTLSSIALVAALAAWVPARVHAGVDADGALAAPTLLPAGTFAAAVALEATVEADRANLAPDLWYGVSDRLTLGITHSHRPLGMVGANRGVCISGCLPADGRYGGVALSAHFPLSTPARDRGVRLVGIAATDVATWSPAAVSLVLGGIAEWRADRDGRPRFWAQAGPRLSIGLLGRAGGNRERASANVTLGATIVTPIAIEVGVGVGGPATVDFFAGAETPVWAQVVLRPRATVGAGIAIGTSDLLGAGARRSYVSLTVEIRVAT